MKKNIVLFFTFAIIVICIFAGKYMNYKSEQNKIKEQNLEFETYLNKQILGTELTTFINRAVDNNEKYKVQKDEQGFYIENDINSLKIEIHIIDNDTFYKMETLYNGGIVNFATLYNSIYFECTKIEYNKLGKVKYMFFEQKTY